MRITESKLRRIIRQVIRESVGSEDQVLKDLEADTGVYDIGSALEYLRSGGRTNESFFKRKRKIFESKFNDEFKRKLPEIENELVKHTGNLSEKEREEFAKKLESAQREVDYLKRKEKIETACGIAGVTIAAMPILVIISSVFFGSDIGRDIAMNLGAFGSAVAAIASLFGGMFIATGGDGFHSDTPYDRFRAERKLNRLKRR